MNWRPAHEWRSSREFWGLGKRLHDIGMGPLSAKLIYSHINLFPQLALPANDTDGKRW